jgi:hypothetical protein
MKRALLLLILTLLVAIPAFAQEDTQADYFTGSLSTEETIINRLPLGENYLLTISGERLTTRVLLRFTVISLDGSLLPENTPARVELEYYQYQDPVETDTVEIVEPIIQNFTWELQQRNNVFVYQPVSFENAGYMNGTFIMGTTNNEISVEFGVGVFPRRPELPSWFTPLSLAIPFVILGVVLFVMSQRSLFYENPSTANKAYNV